MSLRNEKKIKPVINLRRDWSKYSKEKLVAEFTHVNMNWQIDDVQSNWNKLEEILIGTTDKLAPICEFVEHSMQ